MRLLEDRREFLVTLQRLPMNKRVDDLDVLLCDGTVFYPIKKPAICRTCRTVISGGRQLGSDSGLAIAFARSERTRLSSS